MPDTHAIRTFLEPQHAAFANRADGFAKTDIATRAEPADDAAARQEARALLNLLGEGGWLRPIHDLDLRGCCLMREALGEASPLADAVFALQGLGTTPILLGGSAEQKARWLAPIARGKAMTAFAMTEPEAGSDVSALRTTARRDGSEYVLDGIKTLISNAGIADLYAVFASTDPAQGAKGISCFLVPADTPGVKVGKKELNMGQRASDTRAVDFEEVRVPSANRLGKEGQGWLIAMSAFDRTRPPVAAGAVGVARRAMEHAIQYAKERNTFGVPIAKHQAVAFMIADMVAVVTCMVTSFLRPSLNGRLSKVASTCSTNRRWSWSRIRRRAWPLRQFSSGAAPSM